MDSAEEVLGFWFGIGAERGQTRKAWFEKNAAFDDEIRRRFLPVYENAAAGKLAGWKAQPASCLAQVIVLDQFPRNMFRNDPRAFAADPLAREAARTIVERGWDKAMLDVERLFAYLPFEHSEALADQVLCCELMRPLGPELYRYALRHKEIVERFGRFPHRNAALGRPSTPEEIAFLKEPGSSF